MTVTYPTSVITEYHNGSAWVDVSTYVVGDTKGNSGMSSPSPTSRVASLGMLKIVLNNAGNYFTVYGGDAARGLPTLTGWRKGARIRQRVVVGTRSIPLWTGRLGNTKSDDGTWGDRRVYVTCVDYMDVLSRFPMKGSTVLTNQTIDTAATALLARLSIQPEGTNFDVGNETLPAVFSNVGEKTKAIAELQKLVMSELSYAYILKDGTLRIENSTARTGTRELDVVSTHPSLRDTLKLVDGDDFALVDGDLYALEDTAAAAISGTAKSFDIDMDDDLSINNVPVKAYPVRVDTSLVVIFSIGKPIVVMPGQSLSFSGKYTNPSGGGQISAENWQTPVITTDYLMNTLGDGSGTNISSDLTVSATYYSDRVDYVLTNANTVPGFVIKLQARGYGIYFENAIEATISDSDSIDDDGEHTVTLDQRYKREFYTGLTYAKSLVEFGKSPRSRVMKADFDANISETQFMACLDLDIGKLIAATEVRSNITKWYYIYSRDYVVRQGGTMTFTFGLTEAISTVSGELEEVAIEFDGTGNNSINFGYIPPAGNLTQRTYAAWVNLDALGEDSIISNGESTGASAIKFSVWPSGKLRYDRTSGLTGVDPDWYWESTNTVATGALKRIMVTHDISASQDTVPIFYINGVDAGISLSHNASQQIPINEIGMELSIGDPDGKVQQASVWNRCLTAAEALADYNSGTTGTVITDGLVFEGPFINADLGTTTSLNGQQIPAGNNYIEKIFRNIGTPSGAPLIRVPS